MAAGMASEQIWFKDAILEQVFKIFCDIYHFHFQRDEKMTFPISAIMRKWPVW